MDKCKDCYNMNCIFVTETNGCDAVEYCDDFQPMRNSDKIRAMTDGELAEFLNGTDGDFLPTGEALTVSEGEKRWLDWLRQEVTP